MSDHYAAVPSIAYREGWRAYVTGTAKAGNPYTRHDDQGSLDWRTGFEAAANAHAEKVWS